MKILFVCTGNTCRSPMAQLLYEQLYADPGDSCQSAGLSAFAGDPISEGARQVLAERGIDAGGFRARPLSLHMVEEADAICVMTPQHAQLLGQMVDAATRQKIHVLGAPAGISDPYGGDLDTYRRCRDEIAAALQQLRTGRCQ